MDLHLCTRGSLQVPFHLLLPAGAEAALQGQSRDIKNLLDPKQVQARTASFPLAVRVQSEKWLSRAERCLVITMKR